MGYMKIQNLWKNQNILLFKECWAMEKIHGTSAHIAYRRYPEKEAEDPFMTQVIAEYETLDSAVKEDKNLLMRAMAEKFGSNKTSKAYHILQAYINGRNDAGINGLRFFSGGAKHEEFVKLFDTQALLEAFEKLGQDEVTIYGEVFGGKMQGMSDTYGPKLKFIAFEVKIGHSWLVVPAAEKVVKSLGLEFVHYKKVPTTMEALDAEREADSMHAIAPGKQREGIVLRPLIEVQKNNGERIIAKYKNPDFRETKTDRKPMAMGRERWKVITEAREIAEEYVVSERVRHVLDQVTADLQREPEIRDMGQIIKTMQNDIKVEAEGEIIWSKDVEKAIGSRCAILVKQQFMDKLKEFR